MRRQYAEALDYCRLILQYEPHNATARGFYPLLRHKLRVQSPPPPAAALKDETSSSEENSPEHGRLSDEQLKQVRPRRDSGEERTMRMMTCVLQSVETECSAEVSASEGACSSLELDSSEPASPRRTDTSDPSDSSSWHWDSGGSHSERDDNGNPTARHGTRTLPCTHTHAFEFEHAPSRGVFNLMSPGVSPAGADDAAGDDADLRNDNPPLQVGDTRPPPPSPRRSPVCRPRVVQVAQGVPEQTSSRSSLQRLRAHFACSIK
ncbi:unnamed protein product [Danaus chrysippus]|uniref:(African queen) hypothetical protein n=1 Tax=Danaus chrysippus TaxID=151541 RepID=A0A8J2R164_9NEOP|nr:unnamed protein product [Danaus chrysippus]